MKKIILMMFFAISYFSFSDVKNISSIKTLELLVHEKTFFNKKSEEKVYKIKYIVPDMMRKEMIEPKSHKGEIFVYNKEEKKVYLPIFDEVVEDSAKAEENFIIDTINILQKKDKNDSKFRKLYNSGKNLSVKRENISINLNNMKKIDDYYIPMLIKVFDGDVPVSEIFLKNVEINKKIDEKEFDL